MRHLRIPRAFAATVLPFALLSLPAWAEEAGEGDKGGLPQFDASLFPEQIFWLVVSFAVLYLLMAFVALPRVGKTQGNRKRVISAEIETARTANNAAKASVASVEKSLSEARANAQTRVTEMLAKVDEEANAHKVMQEKELLRKLHLAEEDIAVSRTAALEKVRICAADLATAMVDKILSSSARAKA
jgi:F-type H+-transporting ATPase subunit b